MDRTKIDGLELAYRTAGAADGVPAVLIHGYTGNANNWVPCIKPLTSAGFRTLSADNPGHGESASPDDPAVYRMETMADRVHTLATGLGFAPAVVMGHSMGGAMAEEYVIRHPESVRALVLVDSAGGGPREAAGGEAMRAMMEKVREIARTQGLAAVWDYQVESGFRPGFDKLPQEMQDLMRSEFLKTSLPGYLYCGKELGARRHTLDDLKSLKLPVLVVRGENENPGLVGVANDLAATIPRARYEIIPGAAHSPQFENPVAFNKVLLDFLKDA